MINSRFKIQNSKFKGIRIQNPASAPLRLAGRISLSIVVFILILSTSCSNSKSTESNKFRQYYLQGEQLYIKHCSNCHQLNGTGLGRVYPPLNESDFMQKNFKRVICLMKNGVTGELIVNGKDFNQPMPGVPTLTDLEIAEIATYVYNSWEHKRGLIEVKEVSKVLSACHE